ncbi:hypothetical protein NL676_033698 [Syzygium grande]|nr:hypothetical protein NL676_033698 [Syzygium grande]
MMGCTGQHRRHGRSTAARPVGDVQMFVEFYSLGMFKLTWDQARWIQPTKIVSFPPPSSSLVFFASSFRRKADGPSPRGHRLRYIAIAVASASWSSAPPCGRHFCLVVVGSASWLWAPLIVVGSASSPPPRCHQLFLLPLALPRGCGLRSSLSPLPRDRWLRLAAIGSARLVLPHGHRPRDRRLCSSPLLAIWVHCHAVTRPQYCFLSSWPSACGRGALPRVTTTTASPRGCGPARRRFCLIATTQLVSLRLVAIGLMTIGFGSSPLPRGVGSARGRGLRLMAIGSTSWRGLYS